MAQNLTNRILSKNRLRGGDEQASYVRHTGPASPVTSFSFSPDETGHSRMVTAMKSRKESYAALTDCSTRQYLLLLRP